MRFKYLGLAVGLCSFCAAANNVTVYRWVDENNVVHFSQHQPKHDNYTELTMSAVTTKPKTTTNSAEEKTANVEPIKIKGSTEKCEEAKANVRTLKAYDKIQYTDENGNVQVLSATEKSQQLAINEKQVEVYCKGQ